MDLSVPAVTLAALLLGTARATGFVLLAPPFNSRTIPGPVKAALPAVAGGRNRPDRHPVSAAVVHRGEERSRCRMI